MNVRDFIWVLTVIANQSEKLTFFLLWFFELQTVLGEFHDRFLIYNSEFMRLTSKLLHNDRAY